VFSLAHIGDVLFSGSGDCSVRLWNVNTRALPWATIWSVPCRLPVLVAQCRSGLQRHWSGLPHLPAGTAPVQLGVRLDGLICEHCCSALPVGTACRTARGTVSTEWVGGAAGTCLTVLEGHLDWVNALHVMDGILCAY
jgi:hypothetical protein